MNFGKRVPGFRLVLLLSLSLISRGLPAQIRYVFNFDFLTNRPKIMYTIDTAHFYTYTEEGLLTDKPEYTEVLRKYKLIKTDPNIFRVTEYWKNGNVKSRKNSVEGSPNRLIGEIKEYNKDGKLEFETMYKKGDHDGYYESGPRILYYENGQTAAVTNPLYTHTGFWPKMINGWDSNGVQTVVDGSGYYSESFKDPWTGQRFRFCSKVTSGLIDSVWTGFYPNGKVYCREIYKKGVFYSGVSYDSVGTEYTYKDELLQTNTYEYNYNKIMETFIDFVAYDVKENFGGPILDVTRLNHRAAATCLIKVFTNAEAEVTNIQYIKGINEDIDKELRFAATKIPKLQKVKYLGQYVPENYYISLIFPYD